MKKPEKILILGGGTAGWLAALMLNHAWSNKNICITLVESPDVDTIGVGEGSTPAMAQLFHRLGFAEEEWMPECNATYKCGINFTGWSAQPENKSYFHPFSTTLDKYTLPIFIYAAHARMAGMNIQVAPDNFFLSARLAKNYYAPKAAGTAAPDVLYGYHFDATLLGAYLRKKAISRGVIYQRHHIKDAVQAECGKIKAITTKDGINLHADFFVDCTGFASVLLQKTLKTHFLSYDNFLFNNAAVTLATNLESNVPSYTQSTALNNGWLWNIPLTNRMGNGYVYSDHFCDKSTAEFELRKQLGMLDSDIAARHLNMRVGRVSQHWQKNCLGVGLSQGFIEPLEATALYLVQQTLDLFIDAVEKGNFTDQYRDLFNIEMNNYFDGVRDYIVTHYKTSQRIDTEYWRANKENRNISDSLKIIYQAWFKGENLSLVLKALNAERYYPSPSWYCIFTGMGCWAPPSLNVEVSKKLLTDIEMIDLFIHRNTAQFISHASYLGEVKRCYEKLS